MSEIQPVIRTRWLEIVDDHDRPRLRAGIVEENMSLQLLDPAGAVRLSLSVGADGRAAVFTLSGVDERGVAILTDAEGNATVGVGEPNGEGVQLYHHAPGGSLDDGSGICVQDAECRLRAWITLARDGSPIVRVLGEDGEALVEWLAPA